MNAQFEEKPLNSNDLSNQPYYYEEEPQEQNVDPSSTRKKMIMFIITLIAWLIFLITGWISLYWLTKKKVVYSIRRITDEYYYYALQMNSGMIYFLVIFIMILATLSFLIYLYKSFIKKDQIFLDLILGYVSRFHFIPLFLSSGLFIVGEGGSQGNHTQQIVGIIFVILTIGALGFMYYMTHFQKGEYLGLFIKKGFYSALLSFDLYYFFYVICQLAEFDKPYNISMFKGLACFFEIIMGILALGAAFFFKDVMIDVVFFFIYIGILIYHYNMTEIYRQLIDIGSVDVVLSIIFLISLITEIIILGIKYNKELLEA